MSSARAPRVVVLHALRPTSRQTTISHLGSFRRHLPEADVRYLHFAQPLPSDLEVPSVDFLVVNYDFLNYRFTPIWPYIKDRWIGLAERARNRVAIPQDDPWGCRLLDAWCETWQIDRVLTPLDSEWESIYPRTLRRAEVRTVLTGYADDSIHDGLPLRERFIDLGQRVRRMPPHMGRYGQEKARQAVDFGAAAERAGFRVDVSDRNQDAFLGDSWFDFLRSCRFTIGMKGGSSRVDPRGIEYLRVQRYLARNPSAEYEEIARRALRGSDGREITAISPRLFESAATGTCQILPPTDYLGVLEPWRHYLPLERDFSNADEVLRRMRDLESAQAVAVAARQVLVESGRYTDALLVEAAIADFTGRTLDDDSTSWSRFMQALEFSMEVWVSDGAIAHDAVQGTIRWMIDHGVHSSGVDKVVRTLNRPETVGLSEVLQFLRDSDRWEWFCTVLDWSRSDSALRRSPWTWRPL